MQLAVSNTKIGRYEQAESAARSAVALQPDAATTEGLEARAVLVAILLPGGRQAQARLLIDEVERALPLPRRPPSTGLARMLDVQGALFEIDNHFDEAVALWRRAVAVAVAVGVEGPLSSTASRVRIRMAAEELGRNRVDDARRNLLAATRALGAAGNAGRVQAAIETARFASSAFSLGHIDHAEAQSMVDDAHREVAALVAGLPATVLANIEVRQGVIALDHGDLVAAGELLKRAVPLIDAATDGLIDKRFLAGYLGGWAMASGQHDLAAMLLPPAQVRRAAAAQPVPPARRRGADGP